MSDRASSPGESAIAPTEENCEIDLVSQAIDRTCHSAKVPPGYAQLEDAIPESSSAVPESDNGIESADSDMGYYRRQRRGEADPRAFSRLLELIIDRGVTIWFDASGMHWSAGEDAVDAELLRLLRRFKEPLRQAWGPERLPEVDSDGATGRGGGVSRRRGPFPLTIPAAGVLGGNEETSSTLPS